jgi:FOG: PKD repeat
MKRHPILCPDALSSLASAASAIKFAAIALLLCSAVGAAAHSHDAGVGSNEKHDRAPLEFVENKGQWNAPFLFKASTAHSDFYLEKKGFTVVLAANDNLLKIHEMKEGKLPAPQQLKFHAYKVHFVGAQEAELVEGKKSQPHFYNYFLGNNPTNWKTNIHPCLNVDYSNVYQGVDLHVASADADVKYDFIVQPGSDISQIKLQYEGVEKLSVKNDNLLVQTSVGTVEEMKPYAYQYRDGRQIEVMCRYKISGDVVSFSFPRGYDETIPLIIDPTIRFATFTGSTSDNWGFTATYDAQGNLYAGGNCAGTGYPTTVGPTYQGGGPGGGNGTTYLSDISITKFNAGGTGIVWSTYIGGSDNEQPHSMVVDPSGNLVVAGRTYSNNFPTHTQAYDATFNTSGNADMVIFKLGATGAMVNSTYYGGELEDGANISSAWGTVTSLKHSYGDDARSEVLTDNAGNVYVATCTQNSGLPGVAGTFGGAQDGLVLKFNSGLSTLNWGRYIGGTGDDAAYVLAFNKAQTVLYVAGGVTGSALPAGSTTGTIYPNPRGGIDGFIARFDNSTNALLNATYIGSPAYDQCFGIQVDTDDDVYVMGNTLGTEASFPSTAGVASNPGGAQFIMKLAPTLAGPAMYNLRFGTPNASAVNISPVAFLVDTCQNVYVSGWGGPTASNGGSTAGMPTYFPATNPVTPGGILSTSTDGGDFYFYVVSKNGINLQFAGFYGGVNLGEHVDGGTSRFDKYGVIYQAICGGCGGLSTLPTTTGSYSQQNRSNNCNLAAIKIEFNLGEVRAQAGAEPNASICLGEAVTFSNNSFNAAAYEWDFGDGSPGSTLQIPAPHTYTSVGIYTVRMIAINPNACKVRDTVYLQITVDTNRLDANFEVQKLDSCTLFRASVTNLSRYGTEPNAPANTTFQWFWGDGNSDVGVTPPIHSYAAVGTYTITMVMIDTFTCNSPDTVQRTVSYNNSFVKADFTVPPGCERTDISFSNVSTLGETYIWYFGDGDTSHSATPMHSYDTAGTYRIVLYAFNPATCNQVDSVIKEIKINPSPVADFTYAPLVPERNVPTTFTNKSTGAILYNWDFGDKVGSQEINPSHFYKRTGKYTVCLVASNTEGCSDTICKVVEADVMPLVDVPTAFTPNGDGKNDVFYVRGAAIESANLAVYNRWGQKLFEVTNVPANDPAYGWDGNYKGKKQPLESYAFVMSGIFIDGTTFYKKGNVTLLK